MPYTPGSWIETVTVIHKADMDRIEAGVAAAQEAPTGPDADVNAVWHIDGGGSPIVADAGAYQLGCDLFTFGTINVGDDQATIQALFDAVFNTIAGYPTPYYAVVTGNWSDFTIEVTYRILAKGMYLNVNSMTLSGNPVADPTITNTVAGHGTYVDLPGLYGDMLGRATAESPFTGTTGMFIDPTSEQWSDAGFVKWQWEHTGGARGVSDLMGGTLDRMDVQRRVSENSGYRYGGINVQAYSDTGNQACRFILHAQIGVDGTGTDLHLRGQSDNLTGHYELSISDATVQALFRANPGQTEPVLVIQDESGAAVFQVAADGAPIVKSPDGTQYRVIVANDGTLSTEAV
jgi:hypothetical protein